MFAFRPASLFGIPGSGKEFLPGIETGVGTEPEAVHEVKVRAKRRTPNKSGKDMVIKKPFSPGVKGGVNEPHGKHKEEKDKRTQELNCKSTAQTEGNVNRFWKNR